MAWPDMPKSIDAGEDFYSVPIFIQNFNQVSYLRKQIAWLLAAGYRNICIIDDNSTYAPLLRFYAELSSSPTVRVVRRAQGSGKFALWNDHILEQFGVAGPFVYTDSDVVPDDSCPKDVIPYLALQLRSNPQIFKAGMGLRIDNISGAYKFHREVFIWESQFWRAPVARGLFMAPIDTTFALYRPGSQFAMNPSIRTGWPYLARHEPWYEDSTDPSDEQLNNHQLKLVG